MSFALLGSIFGPIGTGVGAAIDVGLFLGSSVSSKSDERKTQGFQLDAQARQSASDAATARINADILGTQSDAFTRQQEEVIGDIGEQGASIAAERSALAAAEGFGGGGTARSVQAGISRRVSRDITRVRDSLTEQTDIFNLQQQQQLDQATSFGTQATFATQESNRVTGKSMNFWEKLIKPSTWF